MYAINSYSKIICMKNNDTPNPTEHVTPNPTEEIAALREEMSTINRPIDDPLQAAHEARMAALQERATQAQESLPPAEQAPQQDTQPESHKTTTSGSAQ